MAALRVLPRSFGTLQRVAAIGVGVPPLDGDGAAALPPAGVGEAVAVGAGVAVGSGDVVGSGGGVGSGSGCATTVTVAVPLRPSLPAASTCDARAV